MTAPTWKAGDVLAMPQDLVRDRSTIYRGCHVFRAEYSPRWVDSRYLYGTRDCRELRPATIDDIDRLILIETADAADKLARSAEEIKRLMNLREQLTHANCD